MPCISEQSLSPKPRAGDTATLTNPLEPVFVYGTLKKGHSNHGFLAPCPGQAAWAEGLDLHSGPGYPHARKGAGVVQGEIYWVDQATLCRLDQLEEVPSLYQREKIWVDLPLQNQIQRLQAWVYLSEEALKHPAIPAGHWPLEWG